VRIIVIVMRLRYIYISSWLLLTAIAMPGFLSAQETIPADTLESNENNIVISDTISRKKFISRLEFSIDYFKLISLAMPTELKYEGSFGLVTKFNIGIILEAGYGEKTPEDYIRNGEYKVYGNYARLGLNYHFPYLPGVFFIIGANYATSRYQDEATFSIESSLWDDFNGSFERNNLEAQWTEITLGSESKWKSNFYFGFTFRLRVMISQDNFSLVEVYSIPGYGRTFMKSVPAINLYFKYMLNFDKKAE